MTWRSPPWGLHERFAIAGPGSAGRVPTEGGAIPGQITGAAAGRSSASSGAEPWRAAGAGTAAAGRRACALAAHSGPGDGVCPARGIGKTWVGLGVAYAVASGGDFLRWSAPVARGVIYIDGEMPAVVMQQRLAAVANSADAEPTAPLLILTPDVQSIGMPDLSTEAGQALIDEHVTDDIGLIVVDNLSSLARSGRENEAESWQLIQTWALRHRAAGRSVLFVHHAGKGGAQRGTSRREDVLDTVIALRRPADYNPEAGAVFEVHFEKARGIHGGDVAPFEASLATDAEGKHIWTTRTVEDSTRERVAALLEDGLSQQDIAAELGLAKSTVSHHAKALREARRTL